jgi:hypothetical protein
MKYMLLIYSKEDACIEESLKLCHDLKAKGQYLAASPLHSVSMATSVRIRDAKRLVTDGPFAETTEQLGGYFLIDVPNLDDAIAVAAKIPGAKRGTVEIRPVFELPGLPTAYGAELSLSK